MTAVVVGGTKGMGLEIAKGFAKPGAKIVINYHSDRNAAAAAEKAILELGAECKVVQADIGAVEGCSRIAEAAREFGEPVELLVHSAVDAFACRLSEVDPQRLIHAINVGGMSLVFLTQALLPQMHRGSCIIFVTGRGAREVLPNYAAVGLPKTLAEGIVRYLVPELAPQGIRINCVAPSAVATDAYRKVFGDGADEAVAAQGRSNPSGRGIEPRDYVGIIKYLVSPEAEFVNGQVFRINGGSSLLF